MNVEWEEEDGEWEEVIEWEELIGFSETFFSFPSRFFSPKFVPFSSTFVCEFCFEKLFSNWREKEEEVVWDFLGEEEKECESPRSRDCDGKKEEVEGGEEGIEDGVEEEGLEDW